MKREKERRVRTSGLRTSGFMCAFGEAVDCKHLHNCNDEADIDPADCPELSYILREAEEQERAHS